MFTQFLQCYVRVMRSFSHEEMCCLACVLIPGVCSVGLHGQRRADQRSRLRGGQCPAHAGRGAQSQ